MLFLLVFTLAAAVCDLRTRKLPNKLTVPAFLLGLAYHAIWGQGLLFSLGGFAVGFGVLFVLWLIGGGGGGDAKLMGALGAWLGAPHTVIVLMLSIIFVVLGSVAVLVSQSLSSGIDRTKRRYLDRPEGESTAEVKAKRRLLPFGVPVALATWCFVAFIQLAAK